MADEKKALPQGNSHKEKFENRKVRVTRVVPEKKQNDFLTKVDNYSNSVVNDIIIPGATNMLLDMLANLFSGLYNTAQETLTGQTSNKKFNVRVVRDDRSRTRYDLVGSKNRTSGQARTTVEDGRDGVSERVYIKDIVLKSKLDGANVIDQLYQILEGYGRVTVNELYGLPEIDTSCPYTYTNYGWYDLKNAGLINHGDGTYGLDLPKPVALTR